MSRCCRECRGIPGVCREGRDCLCHWEQHAIARAQDNKPGRPPHPDPVGERVVNREVRAQKRRRRKGG